MCAWPSEKCKETKKNMIAPTYDLWILMNDHFNFNSNFKAIAKSTLVCCLYSLLLLIIIHHFGAFLFIAYYSYTQSHTKGSREKKTTVHICEKCMNVNRRIRVFRVFMCSIHRHPVYIEMWTINKSRKKHKQNRQNVLKYIWRWHE